MSGHSTLAALTLFASSCALSMYAGEQPELTQRGVSDLECPQVSLTAEINERVIVKGCGRWVRYARHYSGGRYGRTIWILDSPVHQGIAARTDVDPRAASAASRCLEGHDCPAGFGCRIESGFGSCEPLCRGDGGALFCSPR